MISFYIFIPIFIWMNLYYLSNLTKLDTRFYQKDLIQMSFKDLIYYLSRVLYWFWLALVCFLTSSFFIWSLIILNILRFPLYHLKFKFYKIYNVLVPLISILILISYIIYLFIKH